MSYSAHQAANHLESKYLGNVSTLLTARLYKLFADGRVAHHPSLVIDRTSTGSTVRKPHDFKPPVISPLPNGKQRKYTPYVPPPDPLDTIEEYAAEVDIPTSFHTISWKDKKSL